MKSVQGWSVIGILWLKWFVKSVLWVWSEREKGWQSVTVVTLIKTVIWHDHGSELWRRDCEAFDWNQSTTSSDLRGQFTALSSLVSVVYIVNKRLKQELRGYHNTSAFCVLIFCNPLEQKHKVTAWWLWTVPMLSAVIFSWKYLEVTIFWEWPARPDYALD